MKKIFVVASILLMCCMFMGCGVKGQLVGTWKSSVEYEDSESYANFEVTILDNFPIELYLPAICISKTSDTLTLNKDGTFSWNTVETYTFTVNMDAAEDDEEIPEGATLKSLDDSKCTTKMSGTWYYHDSDKVILKITNSSEQYNDEDPEVDNEVSYMSAEIVLVDDILFVDNNWNGILEFTKAE